MAKQTVALGSSPNDGTGDTLRDAMDKINDNFDELYSNLSFVGTSNIVFTTNTITVNTVVINTSAVFVGNSTVNTVANSTVIRIANSSTSANLSSVSLTIGTSTVNSTAIAAGANLVINSSSVYLLSSASSTNTVISSNSYVVGNTTVNTTITPISFRTGNSTVTATVNNTVIAVGNSSVNTTANSTNLKTSTVEVTTNTGLTVGNSSSAANGYTFLPNGFKLNWGWVSANSSDGNATFSSDYTTNCWSVTATSNTTTDTYQAAVISVNSSVAEIRTANATSTNVLWIAIGT